MLHFLSSKAVCKLARSCYHESVCLSVQRVDNYEYELPSDFEDEEIDEEAAFTEEDKKQFADWFAEDGAPGGLAQESCA